MVLVIFLIVPAIMIVIVIVSFWQATELSIVPVFDLGNYEFLFGSAVTYQVIFNTLRYAVMTWALTLVIGFAVAFHIRRTTTQIALALNCTVPFWTSNIIRMISWIPFPGRNGLANSAFLSMGVIDKPLEWLPLSDFSIMFAVVHINTIFMIVPILNTMMRIEKSLVEAARDAGAPGAQILWNAIIPLTKPGIMIGTIFVLTLAD